MNHWKNTLVTKHTSIREVIQTIDSSTMQIALVVDTQNYLIGTVTDGDVRRGILKGIPLEDPVEAIMNTNPISVKSSMSRDEIFALMKRRKIHQVPIVNEKGQVTGIETVDQILSTNAREEWVVIMAGGLGTRLAPLTDECPKPLLRVGDKPILETIICNCIEYGFRKFYLCVNYMAEMIEEYFGNGSRWGVEIRYVYEDKKLGTAGALSLIPEKPTRPFIVMNGDLLTKINYKQLLEFHLDNHVHGTMCVREYNVQIPYGVVEMDNYRFLGITEKPVQHYFVNAGVYVLEPDTLDLIPKDTFFDMPSLFENLRQNKQETVVFPIREYWLDIGQPKDFERANEEYPEVFND